MSETELAARMGISQQYINAISCIQFVKCHTEITEITKRLFKEENNICDFREFSVTNRSITGQGSPEHCARRQSSPWHQPAEP